MNEAPQPVADEEARLDGFKPRLMFLPLISVETFLILLASGGVVGVRSHSVGGGPFSISMGTTSSGDDGDVFRTILTFPALKLTL